MLLSGWLGCRAVSAAVRPLCAVGLSGSCQAVTLGPDSDGAPLMSDSAVRLSDTCCQTVRESAVSAVRLSGTVRRCPGFAVRLSDQGSAPISNLPFDPCRRQLRSPISNLDLQSPPRRWMPGARIYDLCSPSPISTFDPGNCQHDPQSVISIFHLQPSPTVW